MSYGVYVYSKSPKVLSRESLRDKMNSYGWDVLFQNGMNEQPVAIEGPMEDEIIVGWQSGENLLDSVRRVIESNDDRGLDDLYGSQTLVGCEIWVECPYEVPKDELEEMTEYKSPEELEVIRTAKSYYSVSTSAGRSPASLEFQEYVARSIAELTDGWVEDPQTGESGTTDELSLPTPWQETVRAASAKRPWYAIGLYSLFGVMGLIVAATGRSPIDPKNWYVALLLLIGVVAFGLFRGSRWARTGAIGLSGILLLFGILTLVSKGITLHRIILTAVHVSILRELFSSEVKAYFD